ncbi:MAG: hypothetical protein O7D34_04780, partial [Ignavibacteria bacterium]|nr:hypothetical protein [Ignavibacteria bacterium]
RMLKPIWDLDAKRDLEGFLSYFHSDYSGWYNRTPLPDSKPALHKWLMQMYKNRKTLVHDIRPVAIKIHGDIAFVSGN